MEILLRQQLRQPLERVFSSLDTGAVAAGSIAQVHRARLVSGEAVALKIQRQHCRAGGANRVWPADRRGGLGQRILPSHPVGLWSRCSLELWHGRAAGSPPTADCAGADFGYRQPGCPALCRADSGTGPARKSWGQPAGSRRQPGPTAEEIRASPAAVLHPECCRAGF
ncbi:AarF/UbiB family protein [Synechococcus sp. WC10meta]|uniref:AarF/UbiB family protein n=1 Tax=Synechococcus sp. WC10meta TaxID=2964537 RepID=UPI0039C3D740